MDDPKTIAAKLRSIRKERRISQAAVSSQIYLAQASVSRYETADRCPSTEILTLFSEVYNVDVAVFGADHNAVDYFWSDFGADFSD